MYVVALCPNPSGTVDDRVRKKRLALPRLLQHTCDPPQRAKKHVEGEPPYSVFCISTQCGMLHIYIVAMAKVCNKIETCKDFGENLSEKCSARNEKE